MTRLRWILVALLVASSALFAAGAIAERSTARSHGEAASVRTIEGAHSEAGDTKAEGGERVLGVDVESTSLVVLAVTVGLALALARRHRAPAAALAPRARRADIGSPGRPGTMPA
jgi:hypothetical protein